VLVGLILVVALVVPGVGLDGGDSALNTQIPDLAYGDESALVAELNRRLDEAGFNPDDADLFGRETRHAVYAFQKHHQLETDGVFTPGMWDLLEQPIVLPRQRYGDRVEIDLGKQVLYVVEGHDVVYIAPISSGNGELYKTKSGGRAYAVTPEGEYSIERNIDGARRSFLGTLYDPYYFRGGFAVHGSASVPNYPASHGCVRVTMWDSKKLKDYLFIDQAVYIYGNRTPALARYEPKLPMPEFA
jgi:peptidoglycan hydrolase-like protein with peptidoglycan-binding domain